MILLRQGNSEHAVEMFPRFRARCCRVGVAFLVGMQALAAMMGRAADAGPLVQPPSKWVVPRSFERPAADDAADPSQDYRWLLSDRQINAQNDEQFVHQARQILSAAGVQFASHIAINYDPTCESLSFHWARLWRGANKLDRLDLSKLHVSPAGLDTDELLFSSEKTAFLMLDDVRVGDIVDYAYTIEGANPALAGKFSDSVRLQFSQSVDRDVTRLIWPSSRRLYIKNHITDIQPITSRKSNIVEYIWDVPHAAGLRLEPPTPVWYDPYPWVQLSEFRNWSDVNRWALRLFTTTNPPSPELKLKINEWKQLPEPADRVLAALRFVQEEVRYLGMQDGPASYEPAQPSVVFARRFGDCKDKSLLLVTVLRALKIEAFPVLVNDRRRQELAELQPSPTDFDYVVVQVNLGGQSYWLDTKPTYARGVLAQRFWPAYGWGLTVSPGVTALTPIPPCPVQPRTTVREFLNIGGLNERSTVKIVTLAEGPDADALRERFANTPREDIERDNLNAYAKIYPFMSRTEPLLFGDDDQQNQIETTEFYAIEKMWVRQPDEQLPHSRVYCVSLADDLVKPAESSRTMPLGVRHPVHQIFHAVVSVTTVWPIPASTTTIENPAFSFQRLVNVAGGRLLLDYEFRSLSDAVAPEAVPAYVRDLDSATDALGYTVIGLW